MAEEAEPEASEAAELDRLPDLARRAARVQDLFADLEQALLRGDDPFGALGALKLAWREFRDAALARRDGSHE